MVSRLQATCEVAGHERAIAESEPAGPWVNRRAHEQSLRANCARKASGRRRHVDPTTSERDYTIEQLEFLRAIESYKRDHGRPFPTWTEVLEVILDLGYRRTVVER
jgi:hypothetical protein